MFFIIWRRWGILVPVICVAAFALGVPLGGVLRSMGMTPQVSGAVSMAATTLIAAAAIWFIAKALSAPPRRLLDPKTGREVLLRQDAGSLFFIPMQYWAFVVLALGALMVLSLVLPASVTTQADTVDVSAQSQSS